MEEPVVFYLFVMFCQENIDINHVVELHVLSRNCNGNTQISGLPLSLSLSLSLSDVYAYICTDLENLGFFLGTKPLMMKVDLG